VVATSKAFRQLARLNGAAPQRKGPFVQRELTRRDVQQRIPRLAKMSAAERAKLRGISVPRGRQILAGAVVAYETMAALDIESMEICPWALREGIVLRHIESIAQEAPFSLQPVHRTADSGATVMPLKSGK
jgi:exopolyphosphatase/guanosine-5'-triphosphate,3'-diphosphate pyrophosphatase